MCSLSGFFLNSKDNQAYHEQAITSKPPLAKLLFCNFFIVLMALVVFLTPVSFARATSHSIVINDPPRVFQFTEVNLPDAHAGQLSIIEQMGHHNEADVQQSRSARYQFANSSVVYQTGNGHAVLVNQLGSNNSGLILQTGQDHEARLTQHGNDNKAFIYQAGSNSNITVSQLGSGLRDISVEQKNHSGFARPVTIQTY